MLVTFTMSCVLEEDESTKDQQKVIDYVMAGNVAPQMACQLMQQLIILEAVKASKTVVDTKEAAELRRQSALKAADKVLEKPSS